MADTRYLPIRFAMNHVRVSFNELDDVAAWKQIEEQAKEISKYLRFRGKTVRSYQLNKNGSVSFSILLGTYKEENTPEEIKLREELLSELEHTFGPEGASFEHVFTDYLDDIS